ncbi:MAG: hypothetical protein ACD_26C00036G0002 [uncultured bacterium]|nr:MAG: hypothetical protein ACD_26C00036G0002 [uncultured bacterium]
MEFALLEARIWNKEKKKMVGDVSSYTDSHDLKYFFIFNSRNKWELSAVKLNIDITKGPLLEEKKVVLYSNANSLLLMDTKCFDKTMKKIVYEGDVVVIDGGPSFVVEYKNDEFNLKNAIAEEHEESGLQYFINLEVLGNIYENPDLKFLKK